MSAATLERISANIASSVAPSIDWESPAGPLDPGVQPRWQSPMFLYRGHADMHWHGQTCHVIGAAHPDERVIVLACGCQASVPWWTLDRVYSGILN